MTRSNSLSLWLAVASVAGSVTFAAEPAKVSDLGWLEGRWQGTKGETTTEEHWTSASGGALVGMNKAVRGERVVSFEFLRVVALEDGTLAYVASPGGGPTTTFRLKELGERSVVFEAPEHDFPQRVIYRLDPDGTLHARVEGVVEGKLEALEWAWRRR